MQRRATRKRLLIITFFLLASISGLVACTLLPQQKAEIPIGYISSLSADFADTNPSGAEAAKLAVQMVNDTGGLKVGEHQQKLLLFIEDDQNNPDVAVNAAQKLIYQKNVVALIGLPISGNAIPVANLAENLHIPLISSASTNPATTAGKKYVFRMVFVDDFQGQVMARFAIKDIGARKAAVLYDEASTYNQGLAKAFKQSFEKLGGQIVAFEAYTTDQNQDFHRQLTRIKISRPDILFLPNYFREVERQVQQARRLGINSTFLGGDSWGDFNPPSRPELQGAFFSSYWHPDIANQQAQAFIKAYRQAFSEIPGPDAALTYDACRFLFQAIQSQGRSDPESIQKGLASIRLFEGVSGIARFDGTGDPLKSAVIIQIQGGKPVYKQVVN